MQVPIDDQKLALAVAEATRHEVYRKLYFAGLGRHTYAWGATDDKAGADKCHRYLLGRHETASLLTVLLPHHGPYNRGSHPSLDLGNLDPWSPIGRHVSVTLGLLSRGQAVK